MNNLSADIAPEATATRTNTGGTDLLEWAGRTSGLDAKVRAAFSGSEDPFGCPLLGDDLGLDETGMQRLFQALANDVEDGSPVFALDSTTTSSHSRNLDPYIRDGFNKAGDSLAAYKLVTFYESLPVSRSPLRCNPAIFPTCRASPTPLNARRVILDFSCSALKGPGIFRYTIDL